MALAACSQGQRASEWAFDDVSLVSVGIGNADVGSAGVWRCRTLRYGCGASTSIPGVSAHSQSQWENGNGVAGLSHGMRLRDRRALRARARRVREGGTRCARRVARPGGPSPDTAILVADESDVNAKNFAACYGL